MASGSGLHYGGVPVGDEDGGVPIDAHPVAYLRILKQPEFDQVDYPVYEGKPRSNIGVLTTSPPPQIPVISVKAICMLFFCLLFLILKLPCGIKFYSYICYGFVGVPTQAQLTPHIWSEHFSAT